MDLFESLKERLHKALCVTEHPLAQPGFPCGDAYEAVNEWMVARGENTTHEQVTIEGCPVHGATNQYRTTDGKKFCTVLLSDGDCCGRWFIEITANV